MSRTDAAHAVERDVHWRHVFSDSLEIEGTRICRRDTIYIYIYTRIYIYMRITNVSAETKAL